MARQLLQSKRALLSKAHSKIEISAALAAMAIGAAIVPPMPAGRHTSVAVPTSITTTAFSRLLSIPSHNGVYRASLISPPSESRPGEGSAWTLEVRTAHGAPVDHARLALESWMPDHEATRRQPARVAGYLGGGRYRVEGLRLDERGWWNVRLTVAATPGTDSLAFNLIR